VPFNSRPFASEEVSVTTASANVGGNVQGVMDLDIQVTKTNNTKEVAVCIPSHPLDVCALRDRNSDYLVRRWWAEWRHNIALKFAIVQNIGPLFLVLEKTDTEQFANCYYMGRNAETNLKLSGNVTNVAQLSLHAGFSGRENGLFGFKWSAHLPDKKWAIFIRSEKLYIIYFMKFKKLAANIWQLDPVESI
jgi:hypothetical protein